MPNLIQVNVDAKDLLRYADKLKAAQKVTTPAIALGLNQVGDGLVASIATNLSRETGLTLDQVRGLMRVRRASRSNLVYDISLSEQMVSDKTTARGMEGKRESMDFGKHQPGQMVVVVTRKDELVCMDCEELEAAGPMPVEIAMEHIPKHPHCRCVIMPYVSRRRLPVTMTSVTGSSASKRSGDLSKSVDQTSTLRQLAQAILDRTSRDIRIELR